VKEMIVAIIVGIVLIVAIFGFVSLLYPDASYRVMSSVMTPDQIAATDVTVLYVAEPINVIPIFALTIVGVICIVMISVARRD
jgi:hypothetical protein